MRQFTIRFCVCLSLALALFIGLSTRANAATWGELKVLEQADTAIDTKMAFSPDGLEVTIAYEDLGSEIVTLVRLGYDVVQSEWQVTSGPLALEKGHDANVAYDCGGDPAIAYRTGSGKGKKATQSISLARLDRASQTWNIETVDGIGHGEPSLAFAPSGSPIECSPAVAYRRVGGSPSDPQAFLFLAWKDVNGEWIYQGADVGQPSTFFNVGFATQPSLAFDSRGYPAIAHSDGFSSEDGVVRLAFATAWNAAAGDWTWQAEDVAAGVRQSPMHASLAIDDSELPVVGFDFQRGGTEETPAEFCQRHDLLSVSASGWTCKGLSPEGYPERAFAIHEGRWFTVLGYHPDGATMAIKPALAPFPEFSWLEEPLASHGWNGWMDEDGLAIHPDGRPAVSYWTAGAPNELYFYYAKPCVGDAECGLPGQVCFTGTCELPLGVCSYSVSDGAICEDGNPCTEGTTCSPTEWSCGSPIPVEGATCYEGDGCLSGTCEVGVCMDGSPAADDTYCFGDPGAGVCCGGVCESVPQCSVCDPRGAPCNTGDTCCSGRCKRNGTCQ